MTVYGQFVTLQTKGFSDVRDVTEPVQRIVAEAGVRDGLVNVFVVGSTASVTTIEYEPALVQDFRDLMETISPQNQSTRHGSTWGDDNGFSHLRASLMGPGLTLPIANGELVLGTWQQIVIVDHDNRPRSRKVFVQVMGMPGKKQD